MRLLVQSLASGRFLVPSLEDGTPEWVASLRDAGGGVVFDADAAMQLVQDHCEPEDRAALVDLDRLGTETDYEPAAGEAELREGTPAGARVEGPRW